MSSKIKVLPPKFEAQERAAGNNVVNITSHSKDWGKDLSPFFLGPVTLPNGRVSKNMENAWQFSKVYPSHAVSPTGKIFPDYWHWAERGWNDSYAHRRPMGRTKPYFALGKTPEDRLDYVAARKALYIPLYAQAAVVNPAFQKLKELWESTKQKGKDLVLIDFDAYDHHALKMSFTDVVNDPTKIMGHGFVLAHLVLTVQTPYLPRQKELFQKALAAGINIDINNRWETGVPHHPKSVALMQKIDAADWLFNADYFCWKTGGDGDNGESLMYTLDIIFETEDANA